MPLEVKVLMRSACTQNISTMSLTVTTGVSGFMLFSYMSILLSPVAGCGISFHSFLASK